MRNTGVRLVGVLLLAAVVAVGVGIYTHGNDAVSEAACQQAEEVVTLALTAIARGEDDGVVRLLHTEGMDSLHIRKRRERAPKVTEQLRRMYRLNEKTLPGVLSTVEAVPDAGRSILNSIAADSIPGWNPRDNTPWRDAGPVAVRYTVDGDTGVSIVLRENGVWRLSEMPLLFSIDVLKYRDVHDATVHQAVLLDNPLDRDSRYRRPDW